jgi:hypothetical protein
MEISTYEAESETEEQHWWFVGRRKLFGKVLSDLDLPPGIKILDVGSSGGGGQSQDVSRPWIWQCKRVRPES